MNTGQRLTRMGIPHEDLAALLLPRKYLDLSARPLQHWGPEARNAVVTVTATGPANTSSGPPPRVSAPAVDDEGTPLSIINFGNTRPLQEAWRQKGARHVVMGTLGEWRGQRQLTGATIVPAAWAGHVCPVYPSRKGVIGGETIRDYIDERLTELACNAAQWLRSWLFDAGEHWDEAALLALARPEFELGCTLDALFYRAHRPKSIAEGEAACRALDRVAARLRIAQMRALRPTPTPKARVQVPGATWRALLDSTGLAPTESQRRALRDIHDDLVSPAPMRRLLAGDVGSGKTLVYGLAAAAMASTGGRTAVLLPGEVLVRQVAEEFRSWWHDIEVATVTNDGIDGPADAPVVLGTSALLHRDWAEPFTLFVVDEQQRFSRAQREHLIHDQTNLLEVSATPLPRSAALLALGGMDVSHLQPWTKKHIETRVSRRDDKPQRRELLNTILSDAQSGLQTAIIYPRVESAADDEGGSRSSAIEMAQAWEGHLPGQVRLVHGQTPAQDKAAALQSMRDAEAAILVATTVIEVGVDLPSLNHIVVIEPERLGLSQLHQLRGRAARRGGEGRMTLVTARHDNPSVMDRLNVLVEHQDGARVAWEDTRLRGFGAIAGAEQSGQTDSPFPGRQVLPEDAELAAEWAVITAGAQKQRA